MTAGNNSLEEYEKTDWKSDFVRELVHNAALLRRFTDSRGTIEEIVRDPNITSETVDNVYNELKQYEVAAKQLAKEDAFKQRGESALRSIKKLYGILSKHNGSRAKPKREDAPRLREPETNVAYQEPPKADVNPVKEKPRKESSKAKTLSAIVRAEPSAHNLIEVPSYHEWNQFCDSIRVEGEPESVKADYIFEEEKNRFHMLSKIVRNDTVSSVEGRSGGGKTRIVTKTTKPIPDAYKYTLEFESDLAFFYDHETVNSKRFIIIPEYQKVLMSGKHTAEALKTLTEGRDARRKVTMPNKQVVEVIIYAAGKSFITAIADSNEYMQSVKEDKEQRRRFSIMHVDDSKGHIHRLKDFQAEIAFGKFREQFILPRDVYAKIQRHIERCINLSDESYEDPFSLFINDYLPETKGVVCYREHYSRCAEGFAKFNFPNKQFNGNKLFLFLEDHFMTYVVYHEEFCKTLLALDDLKEFGEAEIKSDQPVDWKQCFLHGLARMREEYPAIADEWVRRQLKDNKIEAYDPIKRENVVLAEFQEGELWKER